MDVSRSLPHAGRSFGTKEFTAADTLLTRREAAEYLRRSVPTLERWAKLGIGPLFCRMNGRVLYQLSELRRFVGADDAA